MTILIATLLSNAVTASVLAIAVFAISKYIRHHFVVHGLWILVLLKLITPAVVSLPFTIAFDDSWLAFDSHLVLKDSADDDRTAGDARHAVAGNSEAVSVTPEVNGHGSMFENPVSSAGSGSLITVLRHALRSEPQSIIAMLLLIWFAGSSAYIIRLLRRYFRFCRFLRNNEQVDEELISEGYDLAYKMGLKRPPRVRVLRGAFSPMLCGIGRGLTLILPMDLLHRLTPEGRATLVVHELAHYARGDYLVRILETVVTAIYWWHPVVWWVRHELETVEEDCCDSRVLTEFPGQPRHYAEAILDAIDFLSERRVEMPPISSGLGSTPLLKRRLTRIMTVVPEPERRSRGRWTVLASAAFVLPLQMIQFRPEPASLTGTSAAASQVMSHSGFVSDNSEQLSEAEFDAISRSRVWTRVRSPDGRWTLLADHEQQCRFISPLERRCIDLPTSTASCVAFSPDSQRLAMGTTDGRLLVLRAPEWVIELNMGRGSAIKSIDWSSTGDRIALCTEAGDVKVLNSDGLSCHAMRRLPITFLNCLRFTPAADQLIIGCGDWKSELDSALLILDSESLHLISVWYSEFPVALVRIGDHKDEMTCCDWSGRMHLLTLPEFRILNSQWIPKDHIAPLAFSVHADDAGVVSGAF